LEPLSNQLDHQVVGNEVAPVVDRLHAAAEVALGGHRLAQHVARRDVRDPVLVGDPLRLRPLASALDAEEKNVEGLYLRKPS
jgi:hypothetical protein